MTEHGWEKQRIQFTEGIMYQGKNFSRFCIRRTLSDDISTKDPMVHSEADVSIGTQPEEKKLQGDQIIETTD